MDQLPAFLVPFAAGIVLVTVPTPAAKRLAANTGALASPKADRWHRRPVPLLGGVAVYATVLLVSLAIVPLSNGVGTVLAAGTAMFIVGLVDDFLSIKPSTKLTAQIGVACAILTMGLVLEWTQSPVMNALLTIAWIVGITNAFNLLDNMDGLCAGIAAIAGVAFAAAIGASDPALVQFAALLGGAGAGFLVFNFKPASVFLGDAGSLFIGSSFAVLAVASEPKGQSGVLSSVAVPALMLLIPIFDTAFVTVVRKLSARSASRGGRDHTSHRLVALGFSERQAVLVLYTLAAAAAATAVALSRANILEARVVLPLLIVGLVLLGIQLARVNVYGDGEDFALLRSGTYTPLLVEVTYKRRLFEIMLDFSLICIAYYASYVIRFDVDFPLYYELLVRSLPVVIACHLIGFFVVGVYRGVWRYVSASDVTVYLKGIALGSVGSVLTLVYLYRFEGYSRSIFIINAMALGILVVGSRISFRVIVDAAERRLNTRAAVLIFGAGDAGVVVVRELRNNPGYQFKPVGFVDDDPRKRGRRILGVSVVGPSEDLERLLGAYAPEALIISSQKIPVVERDRVTRLCSAAGVRVLQLQLELRPVVPQHDGRSLASR